MPILSELRSAAVAILAARALLQACCVPIRQVLKVSSHRCIPSGAIGIRQNHYYGTEYELWVFISFNLTFICFIILIYYN